MRREHRAGEKGMLEDEAIAWEFVSEFSADKAVSDPTYATSLAYYGEESVTDRFGVIGYYSMIAVVVNVARNEVPDGKPLPIAPLQDRMKRPWPRLGAVPNKDQVKG